MQLIILILILLFLMMLVPFLLPLIAVAAVIALFANFRGLLGRRRFEEEAPAGRRIQYTDPDQSGPFRGSEEVEAPDVVLDRPASVRDDEFWEKDHTVLDVPFEETEENGSSDSR